MTPAAPTILVVDDDAPLREVLVRLVDSLGFRALGAGSAHEAVEAVRVEAGGPVEALARCTRLARVIDLVLTDVQMPVMHGCALGAEINRRWPALRVMVYSGRPLAEHVALGICPAEVPFVAKPFTIDGLARGLQAVLAAPPYRFPPPSAS